MRDFLKALEEQRWDDHRYYHHHRINQSLHLVSAISFLICYAMLFNSMAEAVLIGWLFSMMSRQAGHFFFEPKGYDEANQATHEYKEAVKVGYNLKRKVVLLSIWALATAALFFDSSFFGLFAASTDTAQFVHNLSLLWLAIAVGALLFRTVHLFFLRDVQTGLVWMTKILTDPFHDIMLYYKAPLFVLRGEMLDPMEAKHAARG